MKEQFGFFIFLYLAKEENCLMHMDHAMGNMMMMPGQRFCNFWAECFYNTNYDTDKE